MEIKEFVSKLNDLKNVNSVNFGGEIYPFVYIEIIKKNKDVLIYRYWTNEAELEQIIVPMNENEEAKVKTVANGKPESIYDVIKQLSKDVMK